MKDEAAGKIITEFAALRAKLYSYRMDGEDYKKCKWVKKNVVKKGITHEDFLNCFFTDKEQIENNEHYQKPLSQCIYRNG